MRVGLVSHVLSCGGSCPTWVWWGKTESLGIIGDDETLGVLNINVSWLSDFGDFSWDLSYAKTCQLLG